MPEGYEAFPLLYSSTRVYLVNENSLLVIMHQRATLLDKVTSEVTRDYQHDHAYPVKNAVPQKIGLKTSDT